MPARGFAKLSVTGDLSKLIKGWRLLAALLIVLLSSLSAWRVLDIFSGSALSSPVKVLVGVVLTLGFLLFWWGGIWLIQHFGRGMTSQQRWAAVIGASLFGSLGLLLTSPAGLTRATIDIYAENVWSPTMFTAAWTENELQQFVSLNLPTEEVESADLALVTDHNNSGEVWLISATQSDGTSVPLEAFEAEGVWQLEAINWGKYQGQQAWVSRPDQNRSTLRWSGQVLGPLTLLFFKHSFSGKVSLQWNKSEQTINLQAPEVAFQGVTLPTSQPVVWRAHLPFGALLGDSIGFVAQPDPAQKLDYIIKEVRLNNIFGRSLTYSGQALFEMIRPKHSRAELTTAGVHLIPNSSDHAPKFALTVPELGVRASFYSLVPALENSLLVLYWGVIGVVILGIVAKLLPPQIVPNINIITASLIVAIIIGEIALRAYLPSEKYYVWPPNLNEIFLPLPGIMPGVTGEARYYSNSEGIRGAEFSAEDAYRILAIGGSTTENMYMDQDSESWPHLLQMQLNEISDSQIWVGNVGRKGHTTREHVMQVQYLLEQYSEIDVVLLLVGINDMSLVFEQAEGYDPNYLESPKGSSKALSRAFALLPSQNPNRPLYTRTATWQLLDGIQQSQIQRQTVDEANIQDRNGKHIILKREQRAAATIRDELPDLTLALDEYTRNITSIINTAQAHHVRLIVLTQPTIWRSDLSPEEDGLLVFGGGPDGEFYYSVSALEAGMALYNQRLLEICEQHQVECIDLANRLPKDTTVFYDDVHFNESGSAQVAEILADYLMDREPFFDQQCGR